MSALFAMMSFSDDDPDLHVHFTRNARALEDSDPVEFVRMLRVLEEAMTAYTVRLYRARQVIEDQHAAAAADVEAARTDATT